MNYLHYYKQTQGGDYDSRPQLNDVLTAWEAGDTIEMGCQTWALEAATRGHGEYVNNVIELVRAMKLRALSEQDIPLMLATIEPAE
jgi:hypothetical protein